MADRLPVAALQSPGKAEVAERTCLAKAVADVTIDGDGFLLVAQQPLGLAYEA